MYRNSHSDDYYGYDHHRGGYGAPRSPPRGRSPPRARTPPRHEEYGYGYSDYTSPRDEPRFQQAPVSVTPAPAPATLEPAVAAPESPTTVTPLAEPRNAAVTTGGWIALALTCGKAASATGFTGQLILALMVFLLGAAWAGEDRS